MREVIFWPVCADVLQMITQRAVLTGGLSVPTHRYSAVISTETQRSAITHLLYNRHLQFTRKTCVCQPKPESIMKGNDREFREVQKCDWNFNEPNEFFIILV